MNSKLADMFNLPHQPDEGDSNKSDANAPITPETLSQLEKIDAALPRVIGLDKTDSELDELKEFSVTSYRDLMDLGLQTDPRYSAEIFATAASFMGHAVHTVEAKANKKIKMLELQLKKAQLDHKISSTVQELDAIPTGSGQALDRNELLKLIREGRKDG